MDSSEVECCPRLALQNSSGLTMCAEPSPTQGRVNVAPGSPTDGEQRMWQDDGWRTRETTGQTSQEVKSQICFDFTKGVCTRGEKCKYSHDIATIVHFNSKEKGVCFDYLRNQCHRGLLCRFSHDLSNLARQCQVCTGSPCRSQTTSICFDFMKGVCQRGNDCRYSHDLSLVARTARGGARAQRTCTVCYDYMRGKCSRGLSCKYGHDVTDRAETLGPSGINKELSDLMALVSSMGAQSAEAQFWQGLCDLAPLQMQYLQAAGLAAATSGTLPPGYLPQTDSYGMSDLPAGKPACPTCTTCRQQMRTGNGGFNPLGTVPMPVTVPQQSALSQLTSMLMAGEDLEALTSRSMSAAERAANICSTCHQDVAPPSNSGHGSPHQMMWNCLAGPSTAGPTPFIAPTPFQTPEKAPGMMAADMVADCKINVSDESALYTPFKAVQLKSSDRNWGDVCANAENKGSPLAGAHSCTADHGACSPLSVSMLPELRRIWSK